MEKRPRRLGARELNRERAEDTGNPHHQVAFRRLALVGPFWATPAFPSFPYALERALECSLSVPSG